MAVELQRFQTPRNYTGLSTDTKPVLGLVDVKSTFYEIDTDKVFNWIGTKWLVSPVESYSNAVTTIETDHAHIHNGKAFNLSGKITSLGAGSSYYFLIDPSTPLHWRYYKISTNGGPVDIELYQNPAYSAAGALLTPVNRNRLSSNISSALIYANPTVSVPGTFLDIDRIEAIGTGSNAVGEIEGIAVEWIIDGGYKYLFKITNNSNGTINGIYKFFWYEL